MATRDLRVEIDADAAKFEAGIERARRATMRMETQLRQADLAAAQLDKQLEDEASKAAQKRADAMEKLGRGLVTFGAATLAGLGLAAKAAIDWESAWAGVRKTVDGSPEELAQLEGELRDLATTLPATHAEIAGVAEAAGQLGIATEDVSAFTKVMIDLGETTNLTAQEAATSIAQLMNIMQTAPDDVDNLGAALVDLGNNGASTEKDILELATRLAAAGAQIGLSEADVLGFANAMASLGIEAESGGSALSRVMADMSKAVSQGGDDLTGFAEIAGMSAEEFARAFQDDPAQAIATFTAGLARIEASGGDVFTALDEVGFGSIRVRDALLRLAGGGDLLSESLARGTSAWEDNSALAEEAAKRYDTAEARIQIAKNTLVDLGIDIGAVVLPALVGLVEGASDLFGWFSDLPGPVKAVATVLAGVAGSVALAGGGFLLLAPRLKAASELMGTLAGTAPRLSGALSKLGRMGGIALGLGAVALAIDQIWQASKRAAPSVEDATRALLDLQTGQAVAEIQTLVDMQNTAAEAMDRNIFEKAIGGLAGFGAANVDAGYDVQAFQKHLRSFDTAVAGMVQAGAMDQAEESARLLQEALGFDDIPFDDFVATTLPAYQDALTGVDNDQRLAAGGADELGGALDGAGDSADDATTELEEYLDTVKRATDPVFALNSALIAVDESQSAYNDAVAEFGANSPEAQAAALELAGAVSEAEAAALNGELSFGDFSDKLDDWVAAGLITAEQADIIRGRVEDLRGEAEDYAGSYEADIKEKGAKEAEAKAKSARLQAESFERRYEAKMGVDKRAADLAMHAAEKRITGWGKTSKSADVKVNDFASGTLGGIIGLLANVRSKTITVTTKRVGSIPKNARGTDFFGGGLTWVGEEGPEIVDLPRGSQIFPASTSHSMAAQISSVPVSSSPVHSSPTTGAASTSEAGIVVENLNLRAFSDRFSLRQVQDELAMHGAA